MGIGEFFIVLASFTGAAVAGVWSIALAVSYVRRHAAKWPLAGQISAEDLDAINARLVELEQRDARVEELEERVDFVERALGRSREAKPLNPGG